MCSLILFISIILTIIFVGGFTTSIYITSSKQSIKTKQQNSEAEIEKVKIDDKKISELDSQNYNILVMGDSLAFGTGDETGDGFGIGLSKLWKDKTNKEIQVNNLAVNGAVSSDLFQVASNESTLLPIKNADIVIISIGGNDITKLKDVQSNLIYNEFQGVMDNYNLNLKNILNLIRDVNETCIVVFIGLYNPFGKEITTDNIKILNNWNYETMQIIAEYDNMVFVPTYDLFKYNIASYLTIDNFHPNADGYKAISNRIFDVLQNY